MVSIRKREQEVSKANQGTKNKISNSRTLQGKYRQGIRQNSLSEEQLRQMERRDQYNRDLLQNRISAPALTNRALTPLSSAIRPNNTIQRQRYDSVRRRVQQELQQHLARKNAAAAATVSRKYRPVYTTNLGNFGLRRLTKGYGKRRNRNKNKTRRNRRRHR